MAAFGPRQCPDRKTGFGMREVNPGRRRTQAGKPACLARALSVIEFCMHGLAPFGCFSWKQTT
ncbi:MAG: hypothetical protein HC814_05580 [Rhodobacteraceae bacterium]|nr:hypothetical protein [Paracoccaceae bacterium]